MEGRNDVTRPASFEARRGIEIIRVEPEKPIVATSMCSDWLGVDVHYNGSRSTVCRGEVCPACRSNYDRRWKGYFIGVGRRGDTSAIIEFTARCYDGVAGAYAESGSILGARFKFQRRGRRKNSPVDCTHVRNESIDPAECKLAILVQSLACIYGVDATVLLRGLRMSSRKAVESFLQQKEVGTSETIRLHKA